MQATALVARRDVGEPVGRLEGELSEDLHRVSSVSSGRVPSRRSYGLVEGVDPVTADIGAAHRGKS